MNQSSPIKLAKSLEIRPEKCIFAAIIRPEKCNKALIIRPEKCDLYLERFFRNLLFGDKWDLHNRYLHINPTEEWTVQPNLATPSSTPSSTRQVPDKLHADNPNITNLVQKAITSPSPPEVSANRKGTGII